MSLTTLIPRRLRRLLGLNEPTAKKHPQVCGPVDRAAALSDLARLSTYRARLTTSQADHLDRAATILALQQPTDADLSASAYELRYANAGLLLDLAVGGSPCRAVPMNPAWRTPTAIDLARAADEHRLPDGSLDSVRLSILADALIDAGCDNRDILDHLRGVEPHVRQCWVVGLVLGGE